KNRYLIATPPSCLSSNRNDSLTRGSRLVINSSLLPFAISRDVDPIPPAHEANSRDRLPVDPASPITNLPIGSKTTRSGFLSAISHPSSRRTGDNSFIRDI